MADPRTVKIAQGLLYQARRNSIGWVETADEDEYQLVYDDFAVSIRRVGVDHPDYRLSIYNEIGTEIDSLEARGGQYLTEGDENEPLKTLQELFELARYEGTRADQILDKLLERVGGAV